MTLRGCLWHEGTNGLGVGPMWLRRWLPCRKRFDKAAREHDAWYDTQGDGWARELDDLLFLMNCLKVSETVPQQMMAIIYYGIVRVFRWMFFRYDK